MSLYNERGIYAIVNQENGFAYIGKTENNFGDRRDSHFSLLRSGIHTNKNLQSDWNKYGEGCFSFVPIMVLDDVSNIDSLEVQFISEYRSRGVSYNVAEGGRSPGTKGTHLSADTKRLIGEKNRMNMTGRVHSDSTKSKMSDSQKKRFAKWTESERADWSRKMSERCSGYTWSDDSKARFSLMQASNPNGAKYTADTVRKIRSMHENDGMTYSQISEAVGIPRGTVYNIATYRRWPNLK